MKQFVLTTLLTCLLVMCSLVLIIMAIELYKTRNQLNYLKTRDQEYANRIKEIEQDLAAKDEYLDMLLTDPIFLERVVRERLGYTRPDEYIYRFPKESQETPPNP
jgi:cell division protein DivIC